MRYGAWGLGAQSLCRSPAGQIGASTLCLTRHTLTCNGRTINHPLLKTFSSRPWISTWDQRTSGESEPSSCAANHGARTSQCLSVDEARCLLFFYHIHPCDCLKWKRHSRPLLCYQCKKQYQLVWASYTRFATVWVTAVELGCETQRAAWAMHGEKCLSGDEAGYQLPANSQTCSRTSARIIPPLLLFPP